MFNWPNEMGRNCNNIHYTRRVMRSASLTHMFHTYASVHVNPIIYSLRLHHSYIAVTQPIKYARHRNSKRVSITILLVWAISVAIGSPIVLGLNSTPTRAPDLCMFYNSDFIIFSSLSSFYIPCIIMVFLYWSIFKVRFDIFQLLYVVYVRVHVCYIFRPERVPFCHMAFGIMQTTHAWNLHAP